MEAVNVTAPQNPNHDLRYFINVVRTLAVSEFKLRYFGSVLGYFWTLARPLLMFGILYLVFTKIVKFGGHVKFYSLVLVMNIVLWQYFADATSSAVASLVGRENLVRKMSFPLVVIPVSTALTAALNFCMNLIAVFVFIFVAGDAPTWNWLEVPFLLVAIVLFAIPLAISLSLLYVRFRDVLHIWEVVLQLGYWGTPIIYPVELVPKLFQHLLMFNPLAALLEQIRHSAIDPSAPSAAEAIGGIQWLIIPVIITVIIVFATVRIYKREAPQVAELL